MKNGGLYCKNYLLSQGQLTVGQTPYLKSSYAFYSLITKRWSHFKYLWIDHN